VRIRKKNAQLWLANKKEQKLQEELGEVRNNIAKDFHDDLGNRLARITAISNRILNEKHPLGERPITPLKALTEIRKFFIMVHVISCFHCVPTVTT
jgi:signal transduction histidine kinase